MFHFSLLLKYKVQKECIALFVSHAILQSNIGIYGVMEKIMGQPKEGGYEWAFIIQGKVFEIRTQKSPKIPQLSIFFGKFGCFF